MQTNEQIWCDFGTMLPVNLQKMLKRAYYGRNPVILQNIYLSDNDGVNMTSCTPFGTSVSSVYRWLPLLGRANLTITITHLPSAISFSVMTDKMSMQSSTLLAECIDKAVSNLCIAYGVQWSRRSPPSTPFSSNNLCYWSHCYYSELNYFLKNTKSYCSLCVGFLFEHSRLSLSLFACVKRRNQESCHLSACDALPHGPWYRPM